METTTMGERGQIVIPRSIRNLLKLEKGAFFQVMANKEAIVLRKQDVMSEDEFRAFLRSMRKGAKPVKYLSKAQRRKNFEEFLRDPDRSDVFRQLGLD